jgi:hypothetical protein
MFLKNISDALLMMIMNKTIHEDVLKMIDFEEKREEESLIVLLTELFNAL